MNRLAKRLGSFNDIIASQIRSQIFVLHQILSMIESEDNYSEDYLIASIKSVENHLRRLKKFIDVNS